MAGAEVGRLVHVNPEAIKGDCRVEVAHMVQPPGLPLGVYKVREVHRARPHLQAYFRILEEMSTASLFQVGNGNHGLLPNSCARTVLHHQVENFFGIKSSSAQKVYQQLEVHQRLNPWFTKALQGQSTFHILGRECQIRAHGGHN